MNEAPVAINDAPLDRNVLLFILLIAGITSPFQGYVRIVELSIDNAMPDFVLLRRCPWAPNRIEVSAY